LLFKLGICRLAYITDRVKERDSTETEELISVKDNNIHEDKEPAMPQNNTLENSGVTDEQQIDKLHNTQEITG